MTHPTLSLTLRAQFLSRSLPHSQPPSKLSPSLPHSQPSLFVLIVFFWFWVFVEEVVGVKKWTDKANACSEGGEDGVEVGVREASIRWVWLPDLMRTHRIWWELTGFGEISLGFGQISIISSTAPPSPPTDRTLVSVIFMFVVDFSRFCIIIELFVIFCFIDWLTRSYPTAQPDHPIRPIRSP